MFVHRFIIHIQYIYNVCFHSQITEIIPAIPPIVNNKKTKYLIAWNVYLFCNFA